MTGPPAAANGVVVLGDSNRQVVFANAATAAVLGTAALQHGSLTAPPTILGSIAFFGEGATQGPSLLHAFDLAAATVADLWSPGLQVTGSVDASPVVLGSALWAVTSDGWAWSIGIADPAHPQQGPPTKVVPGTPNRVSAVLPMPDGTGLLVLTSAGVHGIDVSGAVPRTAWSALTGYDMTGVVPVIAAGALLVAAGNRVFALAPRPSFGTPLPLWSYETAGLVGSLAAMGSEYAAIVQTDGTAYLVDVPAQRSRATFSLPVAGGGAARTALVGDAFVTLPLEGAASASTVDIGTGGTATAVRRWAAAAPGFAGPPIVAGTLVYALGTDASLRVYDVSDGTAVATAALPLSAQGTVTGTAAIGVRNASTAAVQLLVDGADYFPVLRDLLIAAAQKSFAAPASLPSDLTFEGLVKAAGLQVPTYVMAWDTSVAYALTDDLKNWAWYRKYPTIPTAALATIFTPGGAIRLDKRFNAQTYLALHGQPGVQVYLEPYFAQLDVWFTQTLGEWGSNHQKIAIFSIVGTKLALVSGFNISTPAYYDTHDHPMTTAGAYDAKRNWHDTGLLLQGPAVDLVEAEFDRRWQKGNAAPAPGSDTYVKISAWQIVRESCLDAPGVCGGGGVTPAPYQDRRLSGAQVAVRVARTVNERWRANLTSRVNSQTTLSGVKEIRDQLVAAIGTATQYVYAENYTFQDASLVKALCARLTAQVGLRAILVVPNPTTAEYQAPVSSETAQYELMRCAYAALVLASHDWSSATVAQGDPFQRSDLVNLAFDSRGIEFTTVSVKAPSGATTTINIRQIMSFTLTATPATAQVLYGTAARYFATPPPDTDNALQGQRANFRRVYMHSKLALVDDRIAVVGSANFAHRSMDQDGELSVFVTDPTAASAIRGTVFGHWGMTTPAAWGTAQQTFAATTTPSLGILPLAYASFPSATATWTWWFLSTLFDPSQMM